MVSPRYALAILILAVGLPLMRGHAQEDKVRELMHKKLTNSQKILEGIAIQDFDKVRDGADELVLISKAVSWRVFKTPQYELHSNDFRRSAETLSKMAAGKNTDGAALAYVDMTLTCVKCHKYVREVRMARAD
jgi:hypothetical protein